VAPGQLTLGTDNGSQFTSRDFPSPPVGPGDPSSPRRLPRPGVPGLHRVLVRSVQEALRLAIGVGEHRPGEEGGRQLHRRLPRTAPFRPCLPQPGGGRRDLARPDRSTNQSDLK
jgi:hypothetical protein